ncbi:MAG TPA: hypothetical protein VIN10_14220 [Bacteroidales bacterium]
MKKKTVTIIMLIWGILLVLSWGTQAFFANEPIDHLLFFSVNLVCTSLWIFTWLMINRAGGNK